MRSRRKEEEEVETDDEVEEEDEVIDEEEVEAEVATYNVEEEVEMDGEALEAILSRWGCACVVVNAMTSYWKWMFKL